MKLKTKEHSWAAMIMLPVEVLADEEGKPVVMVDPDVQQGADRKALYGCIHCDAGLEDSFGTECSGT